MQLLRWLLLVLCIMLIGSGMASAQVFSVSSVQQFQDALVTAQSNGEDDTINVAGGSYAIASTLTYKPSEAKSLVIQGDTGNATVLDGMMSNQILNIDTSLPSSDSSATIRIRNLVFQNGNNTTGNGNGGGLYAYTRAGTIYVENSSFLNNHALNSGGGLYARAYIIGASGGDLYLSNSHFEGNTATDGGGAYVNSTAQYSWATVSAVNNVFVRNTATGSGGGIFQGVFTYGNLYCINNTALENAAGNGGGYYFDVRASSQGNIYNNIGWNNTGNAATGKDIYVFDYGNIKLYNNLYSSFGIAYGNNFTQGKNINQDPLLDGNYRLTYKSPCIDAGENNISQLPATDKDGGPRIYNQTVDLGAYEWQDPGPVITNFQDQVVPVSTVATSNAISVSGIRSAVGVTIVNGSYSINGGSYTASSGMVSDGDQVAVRLPAPETYATTVTATITIGGITRSFAITTEPAPVLLSVAVSGADGSVYSSPAGISCSKGQSSGCSSFYKPGTKVTLTYVTSVSSLFNGWAGSCGGTGTCEVTLDMPREVTANFVGRPPKVLIEGSGTSYYQIKDALDAVDANEAIQAVSELFTEDVVYTSPYTVLLRGGYADGTFSARSVDGSTLIDGSLKIRNGMLRVEHIKIR